MSTRLSRLCWFSLPVLLPHSSHPQVQPVGSPGLLWSAAGGLKGAAGGLALAQG